MAIDVLNLLALVRKLGGQDGPLAAADPERLGLWGHSMGGGISIRAMTVDPNVRAVVLYGSMSGDERRNYEQIYNVFSNQTRGFEELQTAPEDLARLSSANYLEGIQAAVSIHHGELDDQVPPEWSTELCQQLTNLGKTVECFSYPGQPHTFFGDGDQVFIQRTVDFYNRYLR
jgi:dipeptidyl aminopeptidase/acylaminoacyl peptidase